MVRSLIPQITAKQERGRQGRDAEGPLVDRTVEPGVDLAEAGGRGAAAFRSGLPQGAFFFG